MTPNQPLKAPADLGLVLATCFTNPPASQLRAPWGQGPWQLEPRSSRLAPNPSVDIPKQTHYKHQRFRCSLLQVQRLQETHTWHAGTPSLGPSTYLPIPEPSGL